MTLTQINKAGLDEIALDHVFTIGASGSSAYTFQGEGLNGTVNNPTLYLTRGKTYRFENGSGGHPIRIQSTSGASGTAYNTGVTNNAGSGTVIVEVQHDAPDVLYYQCTSHAAMNGILYITGALADGGVTTAKLADDAVTTSKLANISVTTAKIYTGAVTADKIGNVAVTTSKIAPDSVTDTVLSDHSSDNSLRAVNTNHIKDNAVTTAKIADDAITGAKIATDAVTSDSLNGSAVGTSHLSDNAVATAKIASEAVTSAKIADQAVTLAKLPHGTSSNDGKFLRANNGADPSFETVSIPAGTTINNNADNRVITGSGTANTLNGESLVTVDSNGRMTIGLTVGGVCLTASSGGSTYGGALRLINTISSNHEWTIAVGGGDNAYVAGRGLLFRDETTGINHSQLQTNGNIRIVDGNLQVASGHGIDFSPDANATGASSEVLDDYEEGTWTPSWHSGFNGTYSTQQGIYTKVGNVVHVQGRLSINGKGTNQSQLQIRGFPFGASASPIQYQMLESSCIYGFDAGNNNDLFLQNQEGNGGTTFTLYNFGINDGDHYGTVTMSNADSVFEFNFRGTYRVS